MTHSERIEERASRATRSFLLWHTRSRKQRIHTPRSLHYFGSHFSECDCCKSPWLNGSLHSSALHFPGVDLRTAKLCGLDTFQPLHPVSQAGAAHRHMKGELCRFVYYWVAVFQVVPALRFLCEMTLKPLVLEPLGSRLVLCELALIPSEMDLKLCLQLFFSI